jgi:parvulin-like peptidyl-prolyl isomerase
MRWQYLIPFCALTLVAADITLVEEIIAKVNGDIITKSEIDRSRRQAEAEMRAQKVPPSQVADAMKQKEGQLLRDRIDQLLLVQKAKDLSINVEAEVSKQIAAIRVSLKEPDEDKFQQTVKQQLGISFEDYKSEMRNSMLTERVIRQEVGGTINIPKAEVQKYYAEHKDEFVRDERIFLAQIYLSTAGKDAAALPVIEKKAKDLVARARKGERFAELARDNSDHPESAQNGGELGSFKRGELDPALEKMIWDQERHFVTDPIKRSDGWLILRVNEQQKEGLAAIEEVEGEIMNKLYMPRFTPKIREYLTTLREQAFLEIKPGYIDSGAAPGKDTAWKDPAQLKPETVTKEEVASQPRRKRLLWAIPIPGTSSSSSSSSKAVEK